MNGESSYDVWQRVVPYFNQYILPHLQMGRNVLISSHGFAIRALIKYLDQMPDAEWNAQMNIEKTSPAECHLLAPTGRCVLLLSSSLIVLRSSVIVSIPIWKVYQIKNVEERSM